MRAAARWRWPRSCRRRQLAGGGSCGFQYNVQASQDVLLADKSTTKVEELASEIKEEVAKSPADELNPVTKTPNVTPVPQVPIQAIKPAPGQGLATQ